VKSVSGLLISQVNIKDKLPQFYITLVSIETRCYGDKFPPVTQCSTCHFAYDEIFTGLVSKFSSLKLLCPTFASSYSNNSVMKVTNGGKP